MASSWLIDHTGVIEAQGTHLRKHELVIRDGPASLHSPPPSFNWAALECCTIFNTSSVSAK